MKNIRTRPMPGSLKKHRSPEEKAEEAYAVYNLRLTGATYEQISKATGLGTATVGRRLNEYIERRVGPKAEQYRSILIDRCERLLFQLESSIQNNDVKAVLAAAKIIDQLWRYNGLDTIKIEHSGKIVTMGSVEHELTQLALELGLNKALTPDAMVETSKSLENPLEIEAAPDNHDGENDD
jgi:hypothetical protein